MIFSLYSQNKKYNLINYLNSFRSTGTFFMRMIGEGVTGIHQHKTGHNLYEYNNEQ